MICLQQEQSIEFILSLIFDVPPIMFASLKARSHCDGNGKFFQIFLYAVAVTMWTLQLVTMIPIFAIAIAVMNGYWTITVRTSPNTLLQVGNG